MPMLGRKESPAVGWLTASVKPRPNGSARATRTERSKLGASKEISCGTHDPTLEKLHKGVCPRRFESATQPRAGGRDHAGGGRDAICGGGHGRAFDRRGDDLHRAQRGATGGR